MTLFLTCLPSFWPKISGAKILSWINLRHSLGSIIVAQKAIGAVGLVVTIVHNDVSK